MAFSSQIFKAPTFKTTPKLKKTMVSSSVFSGVKSANIAKVNYGGLAKAIGSQPKSIDVEKISAPLESPLAGIVSDLQKDVLDLKKSFVKLEERDSTGSKDQLKIQKSFEILVTSLNNTGVVLNQITDYLVTESKLEQQLLKKKDREEKKEEDRLQKEKKEKSLEKDGRGLKKALLSPVSFVAGKAKNIFDTFKEVLTLLFFGWLTDKGFLALELWKKKDEEGLQNLAIEVGKVTSAFTVLMGVMTGGIFSVISAIGTVISAIGGMGFVIRKFFKNFRKGVPKPKPESGSGPKVKPTLSGSGKISPKSGSLSSLSKGQPIAPRPGAETILGPGGKPIMGSGIGAYKGGTPARAPSIPKPGQGITPKSVSNLPKITAGNIVKSGFKGLASFGIGYVLNMAGLAAVDAISDTIFGTKEQQAEKFADRYNAKNKEEKKKIRENLTKALETEMNYQKSWRHGVDKAIAFGDQTISELRVGNLNRLLQAITTDKDTDKKYAETTPEKRKKNTESIFPDPADAISFKPEHYLLGMDIGKQSLTWIKDFKPSESFDVDRSSAARARAEQLTGPGRSDPFAPITPSNPNIPSNNPIPPALSVEEEPEVIIQRISRPAPSTSANPVSGSDVPAISSSNPNNFYTMYSRVQYNVIG